MAGTGGGHEGDIPSKDEVLDEFGTVEVVPKSVGPGGDVERLVRKGNPKTVHICRKMLSGEDPADVLSVDSRARTSGQLVTGTWRRTGCHNLLSLQKVVPQAVIGGVDSRDGVLV